MIVYYCKGVLSVKKQKIIIIILSLVILGLVSFILLDKFIIDKNECDCVNVNENVSLENKDQKKENLNEYQIDSNYYKGSISMQNYNGYAELLLNDNNAILKVLLGEGLVQTYYGTYQDNENIVINATKYIGSSGDIINKTKVLTIQKNNEELTYDLNDIFEHELNGKKANVSMSKQSISQDITDNNFNKFK